MTTATASGRSMSIRLRGSLASVRGFLRPMRGVHKKYLAGYVALCEFSINQKRVTPCFIAALVAKHHFHT